MSQKLHENIADGIIFDYLEIYQSCQYPSQTTVNFSYFFYGEELLPFRLTPKLEDHPLSAVRDWLFDILAASVRIGGRCITRNLITRHAVVTRTVKRVVISGVATFLLAPVARN